MHLTQLLASRLIKALDETIEANTLQLLDGVENFADYRSVQASAQTAMVLKDRINFELEKIKKSVEGDFEDE